MRLIDADVAHKMVKQHEGTDEMWVCTGATAISLIHIHNAIDRAPTVDAVPVSELLNLRNELYEKHQITMCGLEKLNQLIAVYSSQLKEREHPIESTPLKQEKR